jgi:hypothetical protein
LHWRFALDGMPGHDFYRDIALADIRDARLAFSATSVEHINPIADLQAQYPRGMVSGLLGQFRCAVLG